MKVNEDKYGNDDLVLLLTQAFGSKNSNEMLQLRFVSSAFVYAENDETGDNDSLNSIYGTIGRKKSAKELRVLDQKAAQNLCKSDSDLPDITTA